VAAPEGHNLVCSNIRDNRILRSGGTANLGWIYSDSHSVYFNLIIIYIYEVRLRLILRKDRLGGREIGATQKSNYILVILKLVKSLFLKNDFDFKEEGI